MTQGARFSCCGVLNRHVLKQLARKCHGTLQNAMSKRNSAIENCKITTEVKYARNNANRQTHTYASAADFCQIFNQEMDGLYLLSFLLTGDRVKAEQCFVSGLDDSVKGNPVFKEWARSWARRAVIQNAVQIVGPRPMEENSDSNPGAIESDDKTPLAEREENRCDSTAWSL